MDRKMVSFETFKHKYDIKNKEVKLLMSRVDDLSNMNGELQEKIEKKQEHTELLVHDIELLKDRLRIKGSPCSSVYASR